MNYSPLLKLVSALQVRLMEPPRFGLEWLLARPFCLPPTPRKLAVEAGAGPPAAAFPECESGGVDEEEIPPAGDVDDGGWQKPAEVEEAGRGEEDADAIMPELRIKSLS